MTDPIQIVIGELASDGLTLTVLGRCHPSAVDYWEGNWIRTAIEARAGGFSANVAANLRSEELQDFRAQLVELSRTLTGTVVI